MKANLPIVWEVLVCSKESFYRPEQGLSQAERDENHHEGIDAIDEDSHDVSLAWLSMSGMTTVTVTPHWRFSHSLYSMTRHIVQPFASSSSSFRYEAIMRSPQ